MYNFQFCHCFTNLSSSGTIEFTLEKRFLNVRNVLAKSSRKSMEWTCTSEASISLEGKVVRSLVNFRDATRASPNLANAKGKSLMNFRKFFILTFFLSTDITSYTRALRCSNARTVPTRNSRRSGEWTYILRTIIKVHWKAAELAVSKLKLLEII